MCLSILLKLPNSRVPTPLRTGSGLPAWLSNRFASNLAPTSSASRPNEIRLSGEISRIRNWSALHELRGWGVASVAGRPWSWRKALLGSKPWPSLLGQTVCTAGRRRSQEVEYGVVRLIPGVAEAVFQGKLASANQARYCLPARRVAQILRLRRWLQAAAGLVRQWGRKGRLNRFKARPEARRSCSRSHTLPLPVQGAPG
jgi:hypothetical protein